MPGPPREGGRQKMHPCAHCWHRLVMLGGVRGAGGTARSGCSRQAVAPPNPASILLLGSSMFRAPCMSQRRLALIFCVSVLIVLLVALILLCE